MVEGPTTDGEAAPAETTPDPPAEVPAVEGTTGAAPEEGTTGPTGATEPEGTGDETGGKEDLEEAPPQPCLRKARPKPCLKKVPPKPGPQPCLEPLRDPD